MLKEKKWSPYLSGIIIGLLQIPVFFFVRGSIGTSSALGNIACFVSSYFKEHEMVCFPVIKSWWQLGFIIGIFLGAYFSKQLSKSKRPAISRFWVDTLSNYSKMKRLMYAFIGGYLFLLGSRIADGCTSGNGISGIALLSIGSFVVTSAMFATGILTTKWLYK